MQLFKNNYFHLLSINIMAEEIKPFLPLLLVNNLDDTDELINM